MIRSLQIPGAPTHIIQIIQILVTVQPAPDQKERYLHMKHRKKTTDLPADSSIETSLLSSGKKPAKKKLPAWVIIPILAVLLLAVWGISLLTDGGDSSASGSVLNVVKVQKGTVTEVYNSSGIIESENTKTYYSPVTAPTSVQPEFLESF